jgi:tRNA modification GTPase
VLANIDFPDEDLADMGREEMTEHVRGCERELRALADTYRTGHAVAEGIPTAICGRTNVGKSSLYNRLVGRDAAIVTDIEGTTRDVLCERVTVGKVTLRLSDTAGLREADDCVEQIGIARARRAMSEAELILAVFDASRPMDAEERRLLDELTDYAARGCTVLPILNKCDLYTPNEQIAADINKTLGEPIRLSAATGWGMDTLIARVQALFVDGSIDMRNDAVVVNARQHASIMRALECVARAAEGLDAGLPLDLCCVDLECAMSELSRMDGRAVDEDIVSEIFSHFCVGK